MKKIQLSLLSVLFLLLVIISCTHEAAEVAPVSRDQAAGSSEIPLVKNSRLAFSHPQQFRQYLKNLEQKNDEQLDAWNRQIGFISLSMANHKEQEKLIASMKASITANPALSEPGADLSRIVPCGRDEVIPDNLFAAVLNKDREVEIAPGVIFRVTRDFCYRYTDGRTDLIDAFLEDVRTGKVQVQDELKISDDLTVYKTESRIATHVVAKDNKDKPAAALMQDVTETNYFRYDRRLVARLWQSNWIVYASSGAETYYQHRALGIWWAAKADRVLVKGKMTGKQVLVNVLPPSHTSTSPGQVVNVLERAKDIDKDENEVSRVSQSIDWSTAIFAITPPFIVDKATTTWIVSANTYHFGSDRGDSGSFHLTW